MKPDPSHDDYLAKWSAMYESANYEEGAAGFFLKKSHLWCEARYDSKVHFSQVLEVGAGTGVHVDFVRHAYDRYVMTDLNAPMLDQAVKSMHGGRVVSEQQDATRLSYGDESFDRVIAAHVLEHLPNPHIVLREWMRVLRPSGTLSLVLPCDPGVAWRAGRAVGSRKKFERAGIPYDYWMAREHINSINSLVAFIKFYFSDFDERWLPLRVPSMDLNLFYIAHIRKNPV